VGLGTNFNSPEFICHSGMMLNGTNVKFGMSSREKSTNGLLFGNDMQLIHKIDYRIVPYKGDILCQHQSGRFPVCGQF
jgi:hypothetical protein